MINNFEFLRNYSTTFNSGTLVSGVHLQENVKLILIVLLELEDDKEIIVLTKSEEIIINVELKICYYRLTIKNIYLI